MSAIYIILGIGLIMLAVCLIDRRDQMKKEIKSIQSHKQEIIDVNQQLDDIQSMLDELHSPIAKLSQICEKIKKYK